VACTTSPESFRRTGERGYYLLTLAFVHPLSALAELTRTYRDAWHAAGHAGTPCIATHYQVVVAEDRSEAQRLAESAMAEHERLSFECRSLAAGGPPLRRPPVPIERALEEGRLIAGDPDDCARQLRDAASAIGCTEVHCLFQFGDLPFAVAERSMELFAAHVLPKLHAVEVES
jgi:alkanesulfonate monooxygenase SsuD/methylene tetrahydromethanopterin reductase-like flavin-dependent oxidoreductase (luciferase family)